MKACGQFVDKSIEYQTLFSSLVIWDYCTHEFTNQSIPNLLGTEIRCA